MEEGRVQEMGRRHPAKRFRMQHPPKLLYVVQERLAATVVLVVISFRFVERLLRYCSLKIPSVIAVFLGDILENWV